MFPFRQPFILYYFVSLSHSLVRSISIHLVSVMIRSVSISVHIRILFYVSSIRINVQRVRTHTYTIQAQICSYIHTLIVEKIERESERKSFITQYKKKYRKLYTKRQSFIVFNRSTVHILYVLLSIEIVFGTQLNVVFLRFFRLLFIVVVVV